MWMRPGLPHLEGEMDLTKQRAASGARHPVGRTFFAILHLLPFSVGIIPSLPRLGSTL